MTIRVHALEESGDYKPWGDCYAPQVVLTSSWSGYNTHALNEEYLPFDASSVKLVWRELGPRHHDPFEVMQRYYQAFYGIEMHHKETHGYSQGDWGHSFVFATPEWLEMTGATGVNERDHNDFCAWLWGDVYEVFDDGEGAAVPNELDWVSGDYTEDCPLIVYGMDEAMKYGDIAYPTHRTITTYEYD